MGTACLNNASAAFGDPAIAAMSIVTRVMQFASSLVIGFGQGFQPFCGFNYGAKEYGRVKQGFFFCVKVCTAFLLIVTCVGLIFAPQIIALFRADDAEVIRIGSTALRLQCATLPLFAFVTIANMMMQTTAQTVRASLVALGRQGLFFLPLILALPPLLGLTGIELVQPLADLMTFILALVLQIGLLRRINRLQAKESGE